MYCSHDNHTNYLPEIHFARKMEFQAATALYIMRSVHWDKNEKLVQFGINLYLQSYLAITDQSVYSYIFHKYFY